MPYKLQTTFTQSLPYYQHTFSIFVWDTLFQLIVICKMASLECILQEAETVEVGGAKLGLWGGWGLDSSSCLAEPFKFEVLTSLKSAHITQDWLWHFSSTIPLTRFLCCPRRHYPWLHLQKSAPSIFSPSSSLQFQLSILWLPSFWPPEGCTPKTLFCKWWQVATQHAWRALMLQQRVLHDQHATPHKKVEKCADNEEDFLKK